MLWVFCCLGVISVMVHVFVVCIVYGFCLGVMVCLVCIGGGVCGVVVVGCCLVLCCFVGVLIVLFGVGFVVVLCFGCWVSYLVVGWLMFMFMFGVVLIYIG